MICQKCGAVLPDNAAFCENCGSPVEKMQESFSLPAETQPMRYTAEPVPAAVPVKKRSKLIPGICIAAGAAVVLGGTGAVVYNMNRASINRMIMGDANYAYSVAMKAASGVTTSVKGMDAALNTAMKAGVNTSAVSNVEYFAEEAASDSLGYDGMLGAVDPGSNADGELEAAANALEMCAVYINELTGMSGAEVSVSGSMELSDSVKEQIIGSTEGVLDASSLNSIIEGLNSTKLSVAEKDSGSAYEYSLDLISDGDTLVDAELRYEKDGTLTVIFPGISSTGLTAKLPAASGADKPDVLKYDMNKLFARIGAGFKEAFNNYDIQYTAGTSRVGGLEFTGLTMEIKLDKDDIADMILIVADALDGDKEFEEYLRSLGSTSTISEIVYSLKSSAGEIREINPDLTASLFFYINTDDTIAGGRLVLTSGRDIMECAALSVGNDAEASVTMNGVEYFAVHSKGTSKTDGRVEYDFTGLMKEYFLTRSEAVTGKYALYMDYTDIGTTEIFGMPTAVGTYKLSLSSDIAELLSGGDNELKQTIEQSCVTISQKQQGKGAVCGFGIDVSGYGKGELVLTLDEPKGDVAPKPDSSYTLVDIEGDADEAIESLNNAFMMHFMTLTENKLVGTIFNLASGGMSELGDDIDTFDYYSF